jgi:hypothetical protein
MPPLLVVAGLDLSKYIRAQSDENPALDPAPRAFEPQWAGSPAFGEGQRWVADAQNNQDRVFPLLLRASTRAGLHKLISEINTAIDAPAEAQYASDTADEVSGIDFERGALDVEYDYMLTGVNSTTRATLHLYSRPYSTTGTWRPIATAIGTGYQLLTATGIVGDTDAQVLMNVRVASTLEAVRSHGIIYGVKYPAPSGWQPVFPAASLAAGAATGSVFGASGRLGSQYRGHAILASRTSSPLEHLANSAPRSQDTGRYRIFAVLRHFISYPSGQSGQVLLEDIGEFTEGRKQQLGKAYLASIQFGAWQLIDFGEYSFSRGKPSAEIQFEALSAKGSHLATYPLQVESMTWLPVDLNAGVLISEGYVPVDHTSWQFDGRSHEIRKYSGAELTGYASSFLADDAPRLRGNLPKLPAVGSPMASGAAQVLVMNGDIDAENYKWSFGQQASVDISVRERFNFLR